MIMYSKYIFAVSDRSERIDEDWTLSPFHLAIARTSDINVETREGSNDAKRFCFLLKEMKGNTRARLEKSE